MIKIVAISLGFLLSLLMISLMNWFEIEEEKVEKINKEHLDEIRRLRKISKINAWLDSVVKPSLESLPSDSASSDDSLVEFFDAKAANFHFKISKYIYEDQSSRNLDIKFELPRENKDLLEELMSLKHLKGFLKFNTLHVSKNRISGEIQVVQPLYGESNASHK